MASENLTYEMLSLLHRMIRQNSSLPQEDMIVSLMEIARNYEASVSELADEQLVEDYRNCNSENNLIGQRRDFKWAFDNETASVVFETRVKPHILEVRRLSKLLDKNHISY